MRDNLMIQEHNGAAHSQFLHTLAPPGATPMPQPRRRRRRKPARVGAATRANDLANRALRKLIAFVGKQPMGYSRLAKAMTRAVKDEVDAQGEPVKFWRQEVNGWLHKDPARRTQPRLGVGLLLIEVGNLFMAREKAKADRADARAAARVAKKGKQ